MINYFSSIGSQLSDEMHEITAANILEKAAPVTRRKMRVLALHGFGQSGEFLRIALKTKQLSGYINEFLSADVLSQFDGVNWFCPDGPLKLIPEHRYGSTDPQDVDTCAWYWEPNNFEKRHEHLLPALEYLAAYITEQGPFDGIVGFSQGAALGMMLASWCDNTPGRQDALATQNSPLLLPSPQSPFKFAISCCGFQGSLKYYGGFYIPKIDTTSFHLVAEYDTMVSAKQSSDLADSFEDATTQSFLGTHRVPTDRSSLYEMARFMATACSHERGPATPRIEYSLPEDAFSKAPAIAVTRVALDGVDTHFSDVSTSPSSSWSELSSAPSSSGKRSRSRLRVIRRTTTIRRVSSWSAQR